MTYIDPNIYKQHQDKRQQIKEASRNHNNQLNEGEEIKMMDAKKKMQKKSKDMILEVPDYFTAEEIEKFFGSKKRGNNFLDT